MKYFSLSSVVQAYNANKKCTKSKFWGLLSILSSIDCIVTPGESYDFDTSKVSNFLENLFCIDDDKKQYQSSSIWNVMFSKLWATNTATLMLSSSPNIYDVIVWYYRRTQFDDDISQTTLLKMFLEATHISEVDARNIFDFHTKEIEFDNSLYRELDLRKQIGVSSQNINAEGSAIVAHPGELSRAPFIQTLYAGQALMECLIITQFKFSELYGELSKRETKHNNIPLQTIYYGCPGTGKSFKIKKEIEGVDGELAVYFDDMGNKIDTPDTKEERMGKPSNIFRTTFHPDFDYSNFVGSYKPVMKKVDGSADGNNTQRELEYDFVPQVFTKAYIRAYKSKNDNTLSESDKQVYIIIEEINRGNCAQIFGDLFQLLDRKDGVSEYPIIPDTELINYLNENGIPGNSIRLPENLHILATMNTSDQSLFPMDSAFKRRWAMEYVPINLEQEKAVTYTFEVKGKKYSWVEFLRKVNPLIRKATDSEDKQMGEFFIKGQISEDDFKNKVMFYIWNDVCKDLYSATRISQPYFMRSNDDLEGIKNVFTFAELYGKGHYDEDTQQYTEPSDLLEGFITKKLGLAPLPEKTQE